MKGDHRQHSHPSHKIDVLVSGRPSRHTAPGTRSDINMNIFRKNVRLPRSADAILQGVMEDSELLLLKSPR